MLRIHQLRLSLEEPLACLPKKIIKKLHIPAEELLAWHIRKESIDARKQELCLRYCVDVEVRNEKRLLERHDRDITLAPDERYVMPSCGHAPLSSRPVVVGFGPAGMFAALLLAQAGYRPLVLERGASVEKRVRCVERFWQSGVLDEISNVQFGEGGAGTFSDGKLTTRVKDRRVRKVLEEFVRFGAPKQILYEAHPHIGTDLLRGIVQRMREEICRLGGEIRFETQLTELDIKDGHLCGVYAGEEYIACEQMILAIGHSARDTMRMLMKHPLLIEPKPFAVGARIEHPQALIDEAQYKEWAGHPRLKAAEYRLTHAAANGRGVYTFCMCPGGYVVPAASHLEGVVVNGMSEHARDGQNANSALLVQIYPQDYGNTAHGAIAFQEELEHKAFLAGGGHYRAPAQLLKDFLAHRPSVSMGSVQPSYALGVTPCDLHTILPSYVCEAMIDAIYGLDKKLHGFALADAVLTGVETRSSSPIRIRREPGGCMAEQLYGCYPCGEGAGYAGGIVSAAIDGLRCAQQVIEHFAPLKK